MSKTLRCVVDGRVQGVFFRAFTRDAALRLGLVGYVRNMPDGRVEAVARGGDEALERFRDFLHQGSPYARVSKVTCQPLETEEPFEDFVIRR